MQSYGVTEWGKPLQQIVRETPAPGPNEVLVRLSYCGVCHSDVHVRQGYFDMGGGVKNSLADRVKLPVVLGHEPIGVVAAVGAEVTDVLVGDTYMVNPWIGCGKCAVCLQGQDNLCEAMAAMGIARPGGFSTHLMVPDKRYLVDVKGIDPARAAVLACSGVTAYSAVQKLGPPQAGQCVAVLGCGGLGLIGIAILQALGHTNAHRGNVQTPAVQNLHGDLEALALLAQDIFGRHTDIVEGHVANMRALLTHLFFRFANGDAR